MKQPWQGEVNEQHYSHFSPKTQDLFPHWQAREITSLLAPPAPSPPWLIQQVVQGQEEPAPPLEQLTATEKTKLASFRLAKRRHEWLAGRLAAKAAVCQIAPPLSPAQVEISTSERGRPRARLPQGRTMAVSISHSGGLAVGLASPAGEAGIDIQELVPALIRIRGRFVHHDEERLLAQLAPPDEPLAALGLLWSAKEALRKQLEIWPLLGFLEARLSRVAWQGSIASLTFTPKPGQRTLPSQLPQVQACQLGNFTLAATIP
ncbi:MAG: 4'-phosphopantetheinyl transferase superfamily protein [Thermodesulfobacteriota bacterium]